MWSHPTQRNIVNRIVRQEEGGICFAAGVDTLGLTWRDIEISPEQTSRFAPVPQARQRNDNFLWRVPLPDGEGEEEMRGVQEAKIGGLRVQIWRNAVNRLCLGVWQSVPVFCVKHNARAAWEEDLRFYARALRRVLEELGCCYRETGEAAKGRDGVMQRLDGCMDTLSQRRMSNYLRVFEAIHPPYENPDQRRFYATSMAMGSKPRRWSAYSKWEETKKPSGHQHKASRKWLTKAFRMAHERGINAKDAIRFELQLSGSSNIKTRLGFNTLGELMDSFEQVERVMQEQMRECLFRKSPPPCKTGVHRRDYPSLTAFVEAINGKKDFHLVGVIHSFEEDGYDDLCHSFLRPCDQKYIGCALWLSEDEEGELYGTLYQQLEKVLLPPGFQCPSKRGRKRAIKESAPPLLLPAYPPAKTPRLSVNPPAIAPWDFALVQEQGMATHGAGRA